MHGRSPCPMRASLNPQPSTLNTPPIRIVAESADWLVVDKPPHLDAHPSKPNGRFTLWDGLRELLAYEIANGGQVSLINRLDRETSGLTLIAKHRESARALHFEMEARAFEKEYLALVWGWPVAEEFAVDAPILRQGERETSRIYLKRMAHPDGARRRAVLSRPRISENGAHASDSRSPRARRTARGRRQNLRSGRRLLFRIHRHGMDRLARRAPAASAARAAFDDAPPPAAATRVVGTARTRSQHVDRGKFARGTLREARMFRVT